MGTMNKLTKIVLSFLMVITCINFSTVQAEDGEEVNYSEPTTVETVSEDPANEVEQEVAQEEPAVEEEATVEEAPAEQPAEEAASVEEPQQEEVAPEASEEAQVEEVNNAPEEAASEEATVAAEPQQEETTATPEESQEEAKEEPAEVQKATVEISYVDEEDKEIADKVSDKEFDVDFVVTADDKEVYKDIDGYTFKEAIVNDDAENRTFTADTIKLDGLKVTSDMNKVKLVYSKNPVVAKKDTTVKKTPKKSSGLLGALEKAVDTLTGKTEEASDDADPLSVASTTVTVNVNRTKELTGGGYWYSDHTWSTDNNDVVKITEENGREATIKGINPGTATVTHTYGNGYVETWTVTVPVIGRVNASVFFLNDPNEDAGSNGTGMWYPSNGESNLTAVLDLTNARFNGEKNLFHVDPFVVSWPDESTGPSWVLPATNAYWDLTFNAYKSKVEHDLGVSISKDDVTKIVLHPHKISDNASGYHLDCNVEVVCRKVITAAFKVKDVNSDIFVNVSSKNYKTDVNGNVSIPMFSQPATKTVGGKTYTFQGWYTDEKCTNLVTEWPTTTKENVNYYGKYVGEYTVSYVANGGTFAEGTTNPSTQLEGAQFTLAAAPTREGYTFQGWKLDSTNYAAGTTYTMPARDITFEAQWVSSAFTVDKPSDVVYNGQSQQLEPVVKDANDGTTILKKDKDYTVSYSENTTNVGEVTVTITGTGNYEGTVTKTYKITPATLTVTTPDKTKVYDGSALTAAGTVTGFVNKETATFTTTGSQTAEGSSENTYSLTWDGTAKESNYTVSETVGTLTVTKQSITPGSESYKGVTVDSPSDVVYNGVEQKWTPAVADKDGNVLTAGTDYTVSYSTSNYTDVTGVITVTITGTGNYEGTVTRTYQITPATLTVTTQGASKVYNGQPLTADGTIEGFVNGETATFTTTGSQTEVGHSSNTYSLTWDGTAKESNYKVSEKEVGTLTVTESENEIVVTVAGGEFEYDGREHTATVTVTNLPEGYTAEATSKAKVTNVTNEDGVKAECDTLVIRNTKGKDVTDKLKIKKVDGTIKITPATLTVTTQGASKVYDGSALTAAGTVTGFVNKETATFTTTGSQTAEGSSENTYSLTWDGTAKESNYTVSETVGTLTVTKQSITPDPEKPESYKGVTVNDPTDVVYNGVEQKWTPAVADKDGNALTAGTDYTVSYSKDTKNVGEVTVTITGAGNYTGTVTRTYKITPRSICFTSGTASKPYDGTPLTNENVSVSGDGFAEGEGATFAVIGTITNVGTKANTFGYALNENTLASNYNISTEPGTLTITPKTITPDQPGTPEEEKTGITVENPGDVKYDGKDHAEKPVIKDEKTGVTLEEGKDYEIVYPEDIKNAGEITATVVGKGDYEGSFEIKFNILKRDVTFTSATDSKQYDGNALTNGNVEITGDGFIEGEGATFNVTGSITDVGSTNNAFTYAMNEGTNADNYNVTVVEGTLTVSEQPVALTPATPTTPSNNTPVRTNNVPARVVTNPTTTTPAPETTVEPEKAETTPAPTAKPEKIKEEVTPQAAPKGHWALINLIAAMLSVVLAVVALLAKHAKDEDEDDEDKDDQVVANENEDDDENESTRHRRWKVIATIDAILAVVVFILTENISLPMVLVDKWTLLMVLFGLISIVSTYFARKWHEEDEDEDEESSQNA